MGWFTDKKIVKGQKWLKVVQYKTGNFKGTHWKEDQKDTTIFEADHPITENDIPKIEKEITRIHKSGWARVLKFGYDD